MRIIKQNKSIIAISNKSKKVHTNLYDSYNSLSQFKNQYLTILIYKDTKKTWMLLQEKNNFINAF